MSVGEPQTFALLVREYRLAAGLTQEELAERAGISARSVSDLERGLNQVPHKDTVGRLAAALGVPEAQLEGAVVRVRGPSSIGQQRGREGIRSGALELPTGMVTFLSMRIDDSRRLAERHPDELPMVLSRLDELIWRHVGDHDGALVIPHDRPDSRLAAFRTASQGGAAAINLQRLTYEESAVTESPLKLCMALHTGEADLREGRYYGSAVNRCARLREMAAGGQILVSQAASELLLPSLPPSTTLRPLGERHLGDHARAEHIYQLDAPGAPHDFPSLAVSSARHAHYDTVLRGLLDGRVVLFAGQATNADDVPSAPGWKRGQFDRPPTDGELAASLAGTFDYPMDAPHDLIRVAQYISTMAGSGPLFDEMHAIFDADYRPTRLHDFLADLPSALVQHGRSHSFPLILTSSYDDALEGAFVRAGAPFDLVSYIAEGEQRGRFLHRTPEGRSYLIDKPNK
jgi:class 3 adenylate cyclase